MVQFYQGTPESVMERLYRTISNFDRSWGSKCVSASDEQIQQLENICAEYGYGVPKVYLDYLKAMEESDGAGKPTLQDGANSRGIKQTVEHNLRKRTFRI